MPVPKGALEAQALQLQTNRLKEVSRLHGAMVFGGFSDVPKCLSGWVKRRDERKKKKAPEGAFTAQYALCAQLFLLVWAVKMDISCFTLALRHSGHWMGFLPCSEML